MKIVSKYYRLFIPIIFRNLFGQKLFYFLDQVGILNSFKSKYTLKILLQYYK